MFDLHPSTSLSLRRSLEEAFFVGNQRECVYFLFVFSLLIFIKLRDAAIFLLESISCHLLQFERYYLS